MREPAWNLTKAEQRTGSQVGVIVWGWQLVLTPLTAPLGHEKDTVPTPPPCTHTHIHTWPPLPAWARGLGLHGKHSSLEKGITNLSHLPHQPGGQPGALQGGAGGGHPLGPGGTCWGQVQLCKELLCLKELSVQSQSAQPCCGQTPCEQDLISSSCRPTAHEVGITTHFTEEEAGVQGQ